MHVLQHPNDVLKQKCSAVGQLTHDVLGQLFAMFQTMRGGNQLKLKGVGLAAPQVGWLTRAVVLEGVQGDEPVALVDPVLVARSRQTEVDLEECLSLAGVEAVPVRRPLRCAVEAVVLTWAECYRYDLPATLAAVQKRGRERRQFRQGLQTRCVLHELDHLDGILAVDRREAGWVPPKKHTPEVVSNTATPAKVRLETPDVLHQQESQEDWR